MSGDASIRAGRRPRRSAVCRRRSSRGDNSSNRDRPLIVPIMDDVLQQVRVVRHEEPPGRSLPPMASHRPASPCSQSAALRAPGGRLVEDDPAQMGVRLQDADQQRAVSAADVDERAQPGKIVGRGDRDRGEPRGVGHRCVEVRVLFRRPLRILERIVQASLAEHRIPGSHTVSSSLQASWIRSPVNSMTIARALPGTPSRNASLTGVSAKRAILAFLEDPHAHQKPHHALERGRVRGRRFRESWESRGPSLSSRRSPISRRGRALERNSDRSPAGKGDQRRLLGRRVLGRQRGPPARPAGYHGPISRWRRVKPPAQLLHRGGSTVHAGSSNSPERSTIRHGRCFRAVKQLSRRLAPVATH